MISVVDNPLSVPDSGLPAPGYTKRTAPSQIDGYVMCLLWQLFAPRVRSTNRCWGRRWFINNRNPADESESSLVVRSLKKLTEKKIVMSEYMSSMPHLHWLLMRYEITDMWQITVDP